MKKGSAVSRQQSVPTSKPYWELVLYLDLEVIVRQSLNGHPINHDAIARARRHLEKSACDVAGRPAHLQCNCTTCSLARRNKT
jgi:hypothetical protein